MLTFTIAAAAALWSCSPAQRQGEVEDGADFVDVSLSADTSNVLRYDLSVALTAPAGIVVKYGEEDSPAATRLRNDDTVSVKHSLKLIIFKPETKYWLRAGIPRTKDTLWSDVKRFATGSLPEGMMKFTDLMPAYSYSFDGFLHVGDKEAGTLYLVDSKCNVVWYQPTEGKAVICSNYDEASSSFACIIGFTDDDFVGEYLYVVDLYGNVKVRMHYSELVNPRVHHDVRILPGNRLLVLNQVSREYDLSKWGGAVRDTVTGDGFTIMDFSGKVLQTWSALDFVAPDEDPNILGDAGEYVLPPKQDYLHANSVCMCPDGNYLISFNKNSQVWKVDSRTGKLLFRLGRNGNVALDDSAAFSDRQHSAYENADGGTVIFDNGFSTHVSRVIEYKVDGSGRKAQVLHCVNLPSEDFTRNQGGAEILDGGRVLYAATLSKNIGIMDMNGNLMWHFHTSHPIYRAYLIEHINK